LKGGMSAECDSKLKGRRRLAFTPDEDDRLRKLVAKFGEHDWGRIAEKFPKRDRRQCRERWFKYLTPNVENGPWTDGEEELLRRKVDELGCRWTLIQVSFPGRTDINIKNHWKQMRKWDCVSRGRVDVVLERPAAAAVAVAAVAAVEAAASPANTFNDLIDSLMLNGEYPDPSGSFDFYEMW